MWLQEEPELQNWGSKQEQVEEVMIGDAEFEVCHTLSLVPRGILIVYDSP